MVCVLQRSVDWMLLSHGDMFIGMDRKYKIVIILLIPYNKDSW